MDTQTPLRIFLVDDDPICLHIYRQQLTQLGHSDITTFSSGSTCLNHLTDSPDVIFLDHGMDILNGLDVLKKIKRFNPDIYVVFLSGQAHIETAVDALKFGAFDYIVKGEHELENLAKVLVKIHQIREILRRQRPPFFRRLFSLATILLSFVLLMTSCATQNLLSTPNRKDHPQGTDSIFAYNPSFVYTLKKGDKINLSVWDNDDLSVGSVYGIYNSNEVYGKWLMIDEEGNVTLPKVGEMSLQGLTVTQAKDKIRTALHKWLVNPIVDLKVLNKEVTILGELKAPGNYPMDKEYYSLLDIVGKAGDFDFYADKRKIQIVRKVDGRPVARILDLTRMDAYAVESVQIRPGDLIYVPSRKGKNFDKRAGATVVPVAAAISSIVLISHL